MTDWALEVEGVTRRFGATTALDDVRVRFLPGEVHALMGENGAGKSTLGKVIAGLIRQDSGTVRLAGREIEPGSIDASFHAGVRIVHQELAQCGGLTVAENLCLHALPTRVPGVVDRTAAERSARSRLARLDPGIDPRARLGSLSPGRRQIVQIASALGEDGADAPERGPVRVIIFDEPTSSLSAVEADRLLEIVRALARAGLACLYVSHRMSEIFACADRITVLRDGRVVSTSPRSELDERTLVARMAGRGDRGEPPPASPGVSPPPPSRAAGDEPLFAVRGVRWPGGASNAGPHEGISFSLAPGEILGIAGLVGAGRSELLDAIFGLDPRARGEVLVRGRRLGRGAGRGRLSHAPADAIAAGIGYVPEDRKLQGLCFELSASENVALPRVRSLARAGLRARAREFASFAQRRAALSIKAPSPRALPGSLSGGNQQKLLLARWIGAGGVRVLLLDEPTRGIDVATKHEIHDLIRRAAADGAGVVLVSSEMAELLALARRVLVLCDRRSAGEARDPTQAEVLRLATLYH